MKKTLSLILALILCLTIAAPAFAAAPQSAEDALELFNIYADVDDVDRHWVEHWLDLDLAAWDTVGGRKTYTVKESRSTTGYYVFDSATKIEITNDSTTDDNYIWLRVDCFVKAENGRYMTTYDNSSFGYSLRKSGEFVRLVVDDAAGSSQPRLEAKAGKSIEFSTSELAVSGLPKDAVYMLTVCHDYPGEDIRWSHRFYFVIDDARADKLAAGQQETHNTSPTGRNPFTDVPSNEYYHDAVLWALENGVTAGTSDTTFSPYSTCTRGQVVTFLWRASGCPDPFTLENPFKDVKPTDYYYKAVLWAYENSITAGSTATTFAPDDKCTSAHVITFLWRANGCPDAEYNGMKYYGKAVAWATANNLLQGTTIEFAPENFSPRADIVTYLYRNYLNNL